MAVGFFIFADISNHEKAKPLSPCRTSAKNIQSSRHDRYFDQRPYVCYSKGNMENTPIPTYQVDQRVVYPSQGVGRIIEIREKTFKDSKVLYYIIYLEFSDMTVMVPVDKVNELGIRPIVPQEEARKALDFISEEYAPIPSDWKLRYQINLDLLKKGSILDIASVVRSLYHRSKIKELPILERKLYDSAINLLQDEISYSLNMPKEEIAAMIHVKLES